MKQLSVSYLLLLLGFLFLSSFVQAAEEEKPLIYVVDIKQEIDNRTRIYLSNGLREAESLGAAAVVLHINTYGGLVDAADSMRTAVLYHPTPVYAFVDNNAASAGALIAIAADSIFMRKGASIGAATVVNPTGVAMPDKYQSYMRSTMRATAEAHGTRISVINGDTLERWHRDPLIAEAMVDVRVVVPGLIDSAKVLTLTATEAMKWNYCEGVAEDLQTLIEDKLGYKEYELHSYEPSWLDDLRGFLMNPAVQSVLVLMIIGGIYFEMQSPGMGFPSAAAAVGAVLYFAPLYLIGVAENWEILLFVAGCLLLAAELFVIPGFGIVGGLGLASMLAGLFLSMLENRAFDFDFVPQASIVSAMLVVFIGMIGAIVLAGVLLSRVGERGLLHGMALSAELGDADIVHDYTSLVGQEGTCVTPLALSGKVELGDKKLYDAMSDEGKYIEEGSRVLVTRVEQLRLYVIRIS